MQRLIIIILLTLCVNTIVNAATTGPVSLTSQQSPNVILAGPASGGSGLPTFRSIAVADVPTLNQNTTGTAAIATTATVAASSTNADFYPTFVSANSGNLALKLNDNNFKFNPSTGVLTPYHLAWGNGAGLLEGRLDDNVSGSMTLLGGISGSAQIVVAQAAGTGTIFQLPVDNGTTGYPLIGDGSGALSYGQLSLTAGVTGTLPVGNGGTGITSLGAGIATFLGTPTSDNLATAVYGTTKGALIFANSPTLVTPTLGVATATSINKVTITAPGTSSTLTIANGSSLITSGANAITLTSTGTTSVTLPTSGTLVGSADSGTVTNTMLAGSIAASKLVGTDIATTGTVTSGTWSGLFGAVSGANLTTLNASNLSSGTVAPARLGSGSGGSTKFLREDSTWQTISGGSGTVTNTGGNLTSNAVVLGAGTVDSKVVAGITTDGTSALNLGVAGTSVGKVVLANATSGTITLSPPTGALGTVTVTVPAATDTLAILGTTQTFTGLKTFSGGNYFNGSAGLNLNASGGGGTYILFYKNDGSTVPLLIQGQALKTQYGLGYKLNWSNSPDVFSGGDSTGITSPASGILEINNASTGGAALRLVNQSDPSTPSGGSLFYSKVVSTVSHPYCMGSAGVATLLAPHPEDAPPAMYDEAPGVERFDKSTNFYLGEIHWTNETRLAKKMDGEVGLGKCRVIESFADYNARTGETLAKRNWEADQIVHAQEYDALIAQQNERKTETERQITARADRRAKAIQKGEAFNEPTVRPFSEQMLTPYVAAPKPAFLKKTN